MHARHHDGPLVRWTSAPLTAAPAVAPGWRPGAARLACAILCLLVIGSASEAGAAAGGRPGARPVARSGAGQDREPTRRAQRRFMWAVAGQESGWDYLARNRSSGAYGKYQIMPFNWPAWAEAYLGTREADQTPWNQERVAYGKLRDLYRWLGSWRRVAYWWLTGSKEPRRERWSAYAAGYVDAVLALRRRAPKDGGPLPPRTSSRTRRGDWRIVVGPAMLRSDAAGRPWQHGGRVRDGLVVRVRGVRTARTGTVWLRVVTADGRLGWVRRMTTVPARAPSHVRRWRDVRDRGDGRWPDRDHVRPRPR